ncbi:MAG: hypothetical protein B6I20_03020, partial [Bacteroidetes bacterium 4572_117]
TIKIGYLAEIGLDIIFQKLTTMYYAAAMAQDEINAAGGINGKKIELVLKDAYADQALIEVEAYKNNGINLIIGPAFSSTTIKIADYAINNNMLIMSYSATSSAISNLSDNDLIWQTATSDLYKGKVAADYLYEHGKRRAAVLYRDDVFGQGLTDAFQTDFELLGGSVVKNIKYPVDGINFSTYDFTSEISQLFSNGDIDVLYFVSFDSDFIRACEFLKINPSFIAQKPQVVLAEDAEIEKLVENIAPTITEGMLVFEASALENDPNRTNFDRNYTNKFQIDPPSYAHEAYDAVYLIAYAMIKANTTDSAIEIAEVLRAISGSDESITDETIININEFEKAKNILISNGNIDYNGASGEILFDNTGAPGVATYNIWEIVNGIGIKISTITIMQGK